MDFPVLSEILGSGEIQFERMPNLASFSAPVLAMIEGTLEFQVFRSRNDDSLRIFLLRNGSLLQNRDFLKGVLKGEIDDATRTALC